jgi:hypothetical protein
VSFIRSINGSGQITNNLYGRKVKGIWRNGTRLIIQCQDGLECHVCLVDQNGVPMQGEFAFSFAGVVVEPKPAKLIELPGSV